MAKSGLLTPRRIAAFAVFVLSIGLWGTESDVIKLIVKQDEVLFGRYSRGHFGALLVLTPLLWGVAAALWSRSPLRRALGNFALGATSTLVAILAFVYLSSLLAQPVRYVERDAGNDERARELKLAGIVRHRPPNEVYELTYSDRPENPRSYPDAPPGYGDVPIVLTSDKNGFRNLSVLERYDLVVVGDSFAAGSHVSDEQSWGELLSNQRGLSMYNLGVSGSGPRTYLNNFAYYGLAFQPRIALFMLYEGNDFKVDVALPPDNAGTDSVADKAAPPAPEPSAFEKLDEHLSVAFKRSPVTAGLRRLSQTVFEPANANRPVPGYQERVGFMPIRVAAAGGDTHYSFKPKRLMYLYQQRDAFTSSAVWKSTRGILEEFIALCVEHGIQPVFLYAPSKPHVVMPLVKDQVPAQQLWNFARYKKKSLPDPQTFKSELYQRLDTQSRVFVQWCEEKGLPCLDLTPALTAAAAAGQQTYYTYDQHWTPIGNRVVADEVGKFLETLVAGTRH